VVTDSIVLADTTIGAGARVTWSVVDTGVVVGRRAIVGARLSGRVAKDADLVLVGRDSQIDGGTHLGRGARLEPGTTT
jgi:glucose-1-phosphate adenylyltransferase